ncbi:exocyst complex component EXO70B1-like [Abrus precatorius]|uniref:Exocyst subunit Exo70 family protein n=1 Tax=Abrus precatorius TaxID=3816 RepID=A0A8B8LMK6_ABRPR|nr:exocyst complex component EXO70B1-like [Abrus precatorius]
MEKNLGDHSGSFVRNDKEDANVNDTAHSSMAPEPTDKVDGEIEKAADADHVHGAPESKEEEKEEAIVEVPPESPPPSLEKVSEGIDQFLMTLQPNDNNNYNHNVDAKKVTLEMANFIHTFLDLVEQKIAKYETGEAKWSEAAEEDSSFLEFVNRISKLLKLFAESQAEEEQEENKVKGRKDLLINSLGAIQQRAMSFLEEAFRSLLEESRNQDKSEPDPKGKHVAEPLESEPATETVTDFPGFTEETITNLKKIAKEMIAGGYKYECCQVYAISRRHTFEESLHKLGYEKISVDEIQKMQWETLEREIPTWINIFKECTTLWFPNERKLTESVFADEPSKSASLFKYLSRSIMIQLLNFAECVAMTKRAGEKLFKLLDMYETLRDVIPNMENLFPLECVAELKSELTLAKCRLGESAVLIFCDLENSIKSETGKIPVAGGAVHPLTRYIMNYLRLACEYKDTLEEVFKEHSKIERADSTSRPHYEGGENKNNNQRDKENMSPFAAQLLRVMELLDSNLEGKAKLYKEVALSCIFMMNNGRYIVQKIKGSAEIYQVMGETWCRKRSTELRTYHKNYKIETWGKIVSCLSLKGVSDSGKVHKPVVKERFKTFNALFEEIHKTQSTWVVSDEQLQSELRVSISALVIPAYRSFLGRFSQYLDPGRQTEKYIKYQAEDIENYIDELFDGNPHHQGAARKKA